MARLGASATLLAVTAWTSLVLGCAPSGPESPTRFKVVSVRGAEAVKAPAARVFSEALPVAVGHNDAGPPDYLIVTLKRILLEGSFENSGTAQVIWESSGGVPIMVTGNGDVDLTGVQDVSNLPVGTVTGVKLTVATQAIIKGSLDANLSGGDLTVYTKAAHSYNAHTYLMADGVAATLADYEAGPAEETSVWWNGPDNNGAADHEFEFPVNSVTLAAGDSRPFTILFDLSRVLRFYDGLDTGGLPQPGDLTSSAYFYSHGTLTNSVVCYFGDAGSIQGYSTLYDNGGASLQPGWMTLIFDAAGNLQAGALIGDLEGAVDAKGRVDAATDIGDSFDISYRNGLPSNFYQCVISAFSRPAAAGAHSDAAWVRTDYADGITGLPGGGGDARYTLRLTIP